MDTSPNHATLVIYAVACIVLALNLLVLWAYSGSVRAKTKTAINSEDAAAFKVALLDDGLRHGRRGRYSTHTSDLPIFER